MFTEKSTAELSAMKSDELHAYYVEKLNHEKEVLESRVKALETEKNSEKHAALEAEVKELKDTQFQTLKSALAEQGRVLTSLREGKLTGSDVMHAEGSVEKALADFAEDFKKAKDGRHEFKFSLKVAGDMTLSGNVTGTVPQAQRLDGVNDIAEREAKTYGLIPKLTTAGNTIEWVYETAQDGTIDGTAEGAAKDQIDNDFVVTSVALVKRAAYFKVSTEMLDDASFMGGWLRNKLIVRLFLDVDNQCLNGDNVAPNLNGIINQATAFAAGTFALTVDNANDVDSLVVAMNQIRLANHNGALTIMMHPSDVAALKLTKLSSTDKRYVDRLLMAGSELSLDGVRIIENTNITAGDFLVGDFSKATIVQKSAISVEVGLDGNDFTKNMRTILAEWRGQLFVQNNDTTAFVTGTFATTNAALETT
jgi:HK97 family phage major capsid protein